MATNKKATEFLAALKAHVDTAHQLNMAWEELEYEQHARGGNFDVQNSDYPTGLPSFDEHLDALVRWHEAVEARIAEAVK